MAMYFSKKTKTKKQNSNNNSKKKNENKTKHKSTGLHESLSGCYCSSDSRKLYK
jgi:hypothetical protein